MKSYVNVIKQVVFTVLVQRVAGFVVDQYFMPLVEKIPNRKKKPFGFHN